MSNVLDFSVYDSSQKSQNLRFSSKNCLTISIPEKKISIAPMRTTNELISPKKSKTMPSYIVLSKKIRQMQRNIRSNNGELDLSDLKRSSPLKKVVILNKVIQANRSLRCYKELAIIRESEQE